MGPGIDNMNLAFQVEPTKEETDNEKNENMIGDQAMVPPAIAFSSNMPIKYNNLTINNQVNRTGRNAEIITANIENIPEPHSNRFTNPTIIDKETSKKSEHLMILRLFT